MSKSTFGIIHYSLLILHYLLTNNYYVIQYSIFLKVLTSVNNYANININKFLGGYYNVY